MIISFTHLCPYLVLKFLAFRFLAKAKFFFISRICLRSVKVLKNNRFIYIYIYIYIYTHILTSPEFRWYGLWFYLCYQRYHILPQYYYHWILDFFLFFFHPFDHYLDKVGWLVSSNHLEDYKDHPCLTAGEVGTRQKVFTGCGMHASSSGSGNLR